ncbi:hypothetical protein [Streptomyces sp. NPDC090445]|uniref:hypothetical protein n=1 Tax=Streptomyces sp. NPDC090445 TaxID=3365963 RepID=UPI003828A2E6
MRTRASTGASAARSSRRARARRFHAATYRPALRLPLVARTIRGRDLVTGALVGVARITGSHQDPNDERLCSEWAQPGLHHLLLADVQALALPIPIERGQLGPWRPSPDLVARVLHQLPHLRLQAGS